MDEPVDDAYLRRPHEGDPLARHHDPHRGDMAQMADEDRRVPRDHPRLEHAGGAGADDPRGIRDKVGLARHAMPSAGGVEGADAELVGFPRPQPHLRRLDHKGYHRPIVGHVGPRPLGDPAEEPAVRRAPLVDLSSSAMRHRGGGLQKEERGFRRGGIDAPATRLRHDRRMIGGMIEAEEAELEAVLPLRLTMAAPRIAGMLCEDRLDFLFKRHRRRIRHTAHGQRNRDVAITEAGADFRRAVGQRHNEARGRHARDMHVGHLKAHLARSIDPVAIDGIEDHDLLCPLGAINEQCGRMGREVGGGRGRANCQQQ